MTRAAARCNRRHRALLLRASRARRTRRRAQRGEASVKRPYVVLLVMDEFPGDSLLDRHRRIDPVRYPNFAALAADATWFRNAFSVYDSTTKAVPLILDGMQAAPGHRGRPQRPPALDLRHVRPPRLPRRGLGGGHGALPAVDLPRRAHAAGRRSSRTCSAAGRSASTAGCARSSPAGRRSGSSTCCCRTAPTSTCPTASRRGPRPRDLLPGMNTVPGFARRVPHAPQRAALPAPARLHRPAARPAAAPAEAGGHLRRHAGRGDRRPRDRVPVRRADAAQRQPVERRGADADPAVREAPRPARRARSATPTRARSTSRRRSRTCSAGRSATATDGHSAFGPVTRGAHSVTLTTRDFSSIVHISAKRWEARRARRGAAAPAPVRLRRPRLAVHRHRAAPRADRTARRRRSRGPPCAPRSPRPGCSPTSSARAAWCRRRSPVTCAAGERAPSATWPSRSTGASRRSGAPSTSTATPPSTSR